MKVLVNIYVRKSDHYKQPKGQDYNVTKDEIEGNTEQDIIDKFYLKNRGADMSCYRKFADNKFTQLYEQWLESDDYKKRSFSLYYQGRIVD